MHSTPITSTGRAGHHLLGPGLRHDPGSGRADGGGQPGEQHPARGAAAHRPVPARRRRGQVRERKLAAGVVQVMPVGRIGGLIWAEAALERHSLAGQPGKHLRAVLAEFAQRLRRDGVANLRAQVAEHGLRSVLHPRLRLLDSAAAGVDDPAGQRRASAAEEPVEDDHVGTGGDRLERGARARRAEADNDHVGLEIPCLRH